MNERFLFVAMAVACSASLDSAAVHGQGIDQGGFVTKLGTDTLAVERFNWTRNSLEGERVLRSPTTTLIRYKARLGKDGTVTSFEARYYRGEQLDRAPAWTSEIVFSQNAMVMDFDSRERGKHTYRVATKPGAAPMLFHSYALYEQLVRQSRRTPDRRVMFEFVYPGAQNLSGTWIEPHGTDSVAIAYFHDQAAHARIDSVGRILGFEGLGTVLKVIVTRVPSLDAVAVAREWAARDAAGQPAGPVSPRDTLRASVGAASLTIDYGRPSKRGRTIFGGLVPWNQVWRTGADAATQFTTSRAITVGTVRLRAGSYTLWTKPTERRVELIINGQTGQWGTDYDPSRDVVHIPLEVRALPRPVERFTIAVVPAGQNAELRFSWDSTEWAVPVSSER